VLRNLGKQVRLHCLEGTARTYLPTLSNYNLIQNPNPRRPFNSSSALHSGRLQIRVCRWLVVHIPVHSDAFAFQEPKVLPQNSTHL
jgi:hypothetical protein